MPSQNSQICYPQKDHVSMKLESERLWFRELQMSDAQSMLELYSDPLVLRYVGEKPLSHIDQAREIIEDIRQQYQDCGIGRWAAFLKSSNEFIGWAGLKYIAEINGRTDNYDLGYRLLRRHWGKGYGTESVQALVAYGFDAMQLNRISGYADVEHPASIKILEKFGLQFTNTFMDDGDLCTWYEIENPSARVNGHL
jgi:ribosomal-protein-alanine N-acetyltransferase